MLLILLRLLIFSVKLVRYMLSSGRTYSTVYGIWLTKTKIIITLCTTKI
ncbi:hypothetical protein GLYMA_18G203602v4 [Glycine max]|nr:hypothetical protein GLYMA_18G203602v4 [Glycine max]